jgi:hypothetical protein
VPEDKFAEAFDLKLAGCLTKVGLTLPPKQLLACVSIEADYTSIPTGFSM